MNSRDKGKRGELEAAAVLRGWGFSAAHRGRQYQGGPDSPDCAGTPGLHVEVKRTEALHLLPALAQATNEAPPGAVPVVLWRKNHGPWVAILAAEDLPRLVDAVMGARRSRMPQDQRSQDGAGQG